MTKRAALSENARLWLDGDDRCNVFFRSKSLDELSSLWEEHGDKATMRWEGKRLRMPQPIADSTT